MNLFDGGASMQSFLNGRRWRMHVAAVCVTLLFGGGVALADLAENPGLTMEGTGLDVAMAGVGLSNLEISGAETLSIYIGGPIQTAALYWVGGGTAGEDDALLVNGSLVTAMVTDVNTDPPAFDVVGYRTNVTALVQAECVTPGLCNLEIEDADLGNNFYSNLVGAGLLVIYTDPLDLVVHRITVFDGIDWAFSRVGIPIAGPVTFPYAAAPVDRMAELKLFTADGEPDRTDRVDISNNPSAFNQIVGNQGPFYDLLERTIVIPANAIQTLVTVVSPPEPPTADSLIFQTAALRTDAAPQDSCTPGIWKNLPKKLPLWVEAGISPGESFDSIFGCSSTGLSMGDAVDAKGGNENKLIRFAAASYLNALHPDVDFDLSAAEVIAMFCAAWASEDWDAFDGFYTNYVCPL
jgi:hypothetical protein